MTGPRHTNRSRPVLGVRDVLVQPGTMLGLSFAALGEWGRVPHSLADVLAVGGGGAVSAAWLRHRHFTPSARLTRAMAECGLTHRRSDGVVQVPRPVRRLRRLRDGSIVRFTLPPMVTLSRVLAAQEALEQHTSMGLRFWSMGGSLHCEVATHAVPDHVAFSRFSALRRPAGRLVAGFGVGRRGPVWVDLASLPHLLVGGQTGGGKSVFLRQVLTALLLANRSDQLQLACFDLKGGVELHRFATLPHSRGAVVDCPEAASDVLDDIRTTLRERLGRLRQAGHSDIDAWNATELPTWPRLLVVIDEVAELTTWKPPKTGRSEPQATTGRLCEIGRLGRAAGIHLIVCTQRPDAEVVPGQLKAQLPATVAFRTRDDVNSRVLLDSDRAALLPPHPGRGLWAHEYIEEFQSVFIDNAESRRLLTAKYPPPSEARPVARAADGTAQAPEVAA